MERTDFIKMIRLRSVWKIDKRKGNYILPNGNKLSRYVEYLVKSQMKIDDLGIRENGNLCFCTGGNWNSDIKGFDDFTLMPPFQENEICSYDKMEKRIEVLTCEILGISHLEK